MKKTLTILLTVLFIGTNAFAADQVEDMYRDLNNIEGKFFQSAVVPAPDIEVKDENEKITVDDGEKFKDHMPFFKQSRKCFPNSQWNNSF